MIGTMKRLKLNCCVNSKLPALAAMAIGCICPFFDFRCAAQDPIVGSPTIEYQRDVRPILSETCFKCHGPDDAARQADLRLDRAEDAAAVFEVEADERPEFIRRITSDDPLEKMPPADSNLSLSPKQIEVLRTWVAEGATYSVHWSLRPIARPEPPASGDATWPITSIDQFVFAKLHEHRLEPSPPAAKTELLRRLAFDLTGLPPTIEELDQFLVDECERAYEKMVDHYLSQSSYGERMAFHWMEVARYADSYGYQVDRDRIVWQWRDWAIGAFNENLPFNEFVVQQLAGDLLPQATDRQILATAFNRLHGQKAEGGSTPEEFRIEYVADRVETLATGFLGMTLECARCHNHKFDPITQREYYQLFAFFNNIDEAGLHSYFTESVPTPTLLLANDAAKQRIADLQTAVNNAQIELVEAREPRRAAFALWREARSQQAAESTIQGRIANLDFETPPAEPNRSVAGKNGSAVELTGDDAIELSVGNFARHQPFSVALWLKIPDVKERAVVFRRSAAWTDAASRGYELLIENGRLSAALVHFWPGNAIRIQSREPLPLDSWTHVVVTYDGSSLASGLTLFVDGRRADCETIRDSLNKEITGGGSDNLAIGARFRDNGFKGGSVDDFQVFDRQLTTLEARQLFDGHSLSEALSAAASQTNHDLTEELFEYYLATAAEETRSQITALALNRKQLNEFGEPIPEIMAMREMTPRRPTYVLRRGAYDAPTESVEPGTPEVMPAFSPELPRNRLGLAKWLTDPAHPLTARVAANRMWQLIFGQGLVRTPEDFGSQGSPPTHPELLDWLARDFIDHGWDVKYFLKQLVMSATYQQSSWPTEQSLSADPDNLWLSRANRQRLDAEMLRDQILYTSGLLDRTIGGASVKPYEIAQAFNPQTPDEGSGLYRRSLYTYWKRNSPPPVMVTLDAVRREICTVKREQTSTPLQAIVLLNDPQRLEAARVLAAQQLAKHPVDVQPAIRVMFRTLTSRMPRDEELQVLQKLFGQQRDFYQAQPDQARALLATGKSPAPSDIDAAQVSALTIVASTIMNMDACLTKR